VKRDGGNADGARHDPPSKSPQNAPKTRQNRPRTRNIQEEILPNLLASSSPSDGKLMRPAAVLPAKKSSPGPSSVSDEERAVEETFLAGIASSPGPAKKMSVFKARPPRKRHFWSSILASALHIVWSV